MSFKYEWAIKGSIWNKLHGYIYIQRVKTVQKIKSEERINISNSQKVKYFSWHVSTLFKDLRLVVSIQSNHTFTSFYSIERLFFSYKVFSSLSPWFFSCEGECCRPPILGTVQEYFWRGDKVRRDTCEEARPSRLNLQLNLQRYKVDLDTKISMSLPQCRTEHSCIEGSISPTGLDIKIIWM